MTPRRKRLWLWMAAAVLGGFVVLLGASFLIMQTTWFANFLRAKTIAILEDSTGGRVEIKSFRFEPGRLTLRIDNLVIHGNEPTNAQPFGSVAHLELRLKLLSGLHQAIDLAYLGAQEPKINIIINPDGSTNIPSPKVKSAPGSKSPLAAVVDLAVGRFLVERGSVSFAQRTTPFSARGDNLRVLLNYNSLSQSYSGKIDIAPLTINRAAEPPLALSVNLPVTIDRSGVTLAGCQLSSGRSQLSVNASLVDLNTPRISLQSRGKVALQDIQDTLNPAFANLNLDARYDQSSGAITLRAFRLDLGASQFNASGTANPATGEAVSFHGALALGELAHLLKFSAPALNGALQIQGAARVDGQRNYKIDGTLDSQSLSVADGAMQLSRVSLSSPFQITPNELSMNAIRLATLGGSVSARAVLEQWRKLDAQAELHGFSLSTLASALAGHSLHYGGTLSGSVTVGADLAAKTNADLLAKAHFTLSPRNDGVPVSGSVDAQYLGAANLIQLSNSSISLPHSRIALAGSMNHDLSANLTSYNLDDFLPLANFTSKTPIRNLPLRLQAGGVAKLDAHLQGDFVNPQIKTHAAITHFAVQQSVFDSLSFDGAASSTGASVHGGSLEQGSLKSTFDAAIGLTHWKLAGSSPISANATLRNAGLDALLAIADADLKASGLVNAEAHIGGTYGDPLGAANLNIEKGSVNEQPFTGLNAQINATHGAIRLSSFNVSTAGGYISAQGAFRHPLGEIASGHLDLQVNTKSLNLSQLAQIHRNEIAASGIVNLTADVSAEVAQSQVNLSAINANLSASNLSVRNHPSGDLTAVAHTVGGVVQYDLKSNFAGSNISVAGHTSLLHGYQTDAKASISALSIKDALDVAGYSDIPVAGKLTTQVSFNGTPDSPELKADIQLSAASIYQEPVDRLNAGVRYTNTLAEISSLQLTVPAGHIDLNGRYDHPASSNRGAIRLVVHSNDLQIAKLRNVQTWQPGIGGALQIDLDASGSVDPAKNSFLLSSLNTNLKARGVRMDNQSLGNLEASGRTSQGRVHFEVNSDLAKSQIHASGDSQLIAGYPTQASLTFNNVRYANIARFLNTESDSLPSFDALVEGKAFVNGPIADLNALQARLEVDRFDMQAATRSAASDASTRSAGRLQNDGPLIIALNKSVLNVDRFRIRGPKANLDLSGGLNLADSAQSLKLNLKANSDLGILQDLNSNFFSSGSVTADVGVGGTIAQPVMNGRIELHRANINYADLPNGLSNGEGVILLNGKTATIQTLSGESGGGKISVEGFAGFSPRAVIYNLRANASRVRSRYNSLTVVSNANLQLTGSSRRSLLSGKVTVQKISYSSSSDIGSILTTAATPPSTDTASSPLLGNMRLDINVSTASDLRVVTSYVEKMDLNSNLHVRGTAAEPGVVGQINIADGQLTFFGNSYTINKGSINFYDPTAIKPELNFSLETVAQGVDVVLGVSGPVNDMKLNYRSDPPLSFEQIVQLLATNTTPFDPTIAAHQPSAPQQSMSQMGESAVLGQAIANPLASRVQRVFGLSQFKIDPSVAGNNGQPTAKITLQQKIANNITFTYITDVTQSNSEIVRIQWDLGPKVSAVALRDYNGNVSVEMFYKFQVH